MTNRLTLNAGRRRARRLRAELTQAFAAPDSAYYALSADDVISRNAGRPTLLVNLGREGDVS